MSVFLQQPKKYSKSHRKRKQGKAHRHKQLSKSSPTDSNSAASSSLCIGSIYRENQSGNLCKKHALATIISTVMSDLTVQFDIFDFDSCMLMMGFIDYNADGYINFREFTSLGGIGGSYQTVYRLDKGANVNCSSCVGVDTYNIDMTEFLS